MGELHTGQYIHFVEFVTLISEYPSLGHGCSDGMLINVVVAVRLAVEPSGPEVRIMTWKQIDNYVLNYSWTRSCLG